MPDSCACLPACPCLHRAYRTASATASCVRRTATAARRPRSCRRSTIRAKDTTCSDTPECTAMPPSSLPCSSGCTSVSKNNANRVTCAGQNAPPVYSYMHYPEECMMAAEQCSDTEFSARPPAPAELPQNGPFSRMRCCRGLQAHSPQWCQQRGAAACVCWQRARPPSQGKALCRCKVDVESTTTAPCHGTTVASRKLT